MFCAIQTPLLPDEPSGLNKNRSSDDSAHDDTSSKIKYKKICHYFLYSSTNIYRGI
jgi:hypothetical protein